MKNDLNHELHKFHESHVLLIGFNYIEFLKFLAKGCTAFE